MGSPPSGTSPIHPGPASALDVGRVGSLSRGSASLGSGEFGSLPYPGLRAGAPGRQGYERGSVPDLSSSGSRDVALAEYDGAVYAPGTMAAQCSILRTVIRLLEFWGLPLLPLSRHVVRCLGASLKAGKYRSASQYLSAAKQAAERNDQILPPSVLWALRDAKRACERGLGPPHKVEGIPMDMLAALPDGDAPWAAGGPMAPKRAIIAGAWWLCRETELSNARACLTAFSGSPDNLVAAWCLPVSKADQGAYGQERKHGCTCNAGRFGRMCPAHTLWRQRAALRGWFPSRHDAAGVPFVSLQLFLGAGGNPRTQDSIAVTIRAVAAHLGLPPRSTDG